MTELDPSVEVLKRTPAALRGLLGGGLSEFWTLNNYGPATFSPFDVVGHLIHAERTNWLPRARMILERGESNAFEPFDRYAMYQSSKGKSIDELLENFATLRDENLSALSTMNLTPEQLDRRGTHPDLGPVTLRQLIAAWVVHDLNHLHQVAKSMAFQYRDTVGPWRAYLSILPKTDPAES
jgi:DinB superfamily